MENKALIALMPMKAHSDRVENKNFRIFHGKPLFRWMLDTLLSLPEVHKIIINTDARKSLDFHGLTDSERIVIRDRKPYLCGDDVSMNLILADDIDSISGDIFLMTHTTNPLLSSDTIRKALKYFESAKQSGKYDSLFSVNRFQSRFYRKDSTPINHDPAMLTPTQALEPWYEENSNLYLFTSESFQNTDARIGQRPVLWETPPLESIDIDTWDDWYLAEAVAQYLFPNT